MAPADKQGRVVFIGNIPYGLTEEQLIQIFTHVGQVLNFRLVYDKDTGRPKGFGFMEFADADAAASAVRNLNDHEVMNRRLRVDYSNDGGKDDNAPAGYSAPTHHQQPPNGPEVNTQVQPGRLPPLPPGVELMPGLTCPDAISRTLNTLPAPQLLDILTQMKGLVMSDPAKATELLVQAPQLSYAIFQSLLLLGLVDTSILATVVEQAQRAPQQQTILQHTPLQQQAFPSQFPPQMQPLPQLAQVPQMPPMPQVPQMPHIPIPTPPVYSQPYQAPPAMPAQTPQDQQAALLHQILAMPQQQIDQMPAQTREQIMQVRQSIMGGRAF